MHIIVLGAGLLGVSTAYELGRRGHRVTVIDRASGPAAEGSYSNGAQLSYTHAEPWASAHVLPKIPFWIFDASSPLVFRPRADVDMLRWGLKFLANCTTAKAYANTATLLRLGLYSRLEMARIRKETGIEFHFSDRGILRIYGNAEELAHARAQSTFQTKYGSSDRMLSREECLALESSLAHTDRTISGGLHAILDEVGDAHEYCVQLARIAAEKHGVQFRYGVNILGLRKEGTRVAAVVSGAGDITGDGYVMALGAYSPLLMRPLGLRIPVYPMKGYSITLDANDFCPQSSITDGEYKIVHTRIGNRLRIAGTAEFTGYDDRVNQRRIDSIIRAAKTLMPKAPWDGEIHSWACLRPSTPDGPPILGRTPFANLYLNTGHGTLGWTQAAGSASIVADCIDNNPPPILMHGLTLR
jgi:D-amino-acid dehydrogenase